MHRIGTLIFILTLGLFISACDSPQTKPSDNILFSAGGRTSEVLVVINDQNWKTIAGDTIRNTLAAIPDWQAAPEPEYRLSQISKKQFGSVYQKFHNILIVEFLPEIEKPKFTIKHNVWSQPQTVVRIKVPNMTTFLNLYGKTHEKINQAFHKNELKRIAQSYKGSEVRAITKQLAQKFSIKMIFPKGFYVAHDGNDFMWLRRPAKKVEEGIFIYTYPYTDTSNFNYHNVISIRDSITKKYIPGPIDNSYMKISNVFPPIHKTKEFKGNYATELRSWWDVKGYAMGGPFISYTFVDTIANRMICIDGYIKAPRENKRDLLLHIEAIFSTFDFVNLPEDTNN